MITRTLSYKNLTEQIAEWRRNTEAKQTFIKKNDKPKDKF